MANSPRERFLVEDLGSGVIDLHLIQKIMAWGVGVLRKYKAPKWWGGSHTEQGVHWASLK